MPCGWEDNRSSWECNRRSGVALVMRHRLQWFIHLRAHGLRKVDKHLAYTPNGVWHELHWLPIRDRVEFQVACMVRQSLSGQAPLYLADDCCLVSDSTLRSLRSADVSTCVVPPTLSSYGDRTFAAAGPRLWNSLPVPLRNRDITYGVFRRQVKGHLFGKHKHGVL